MTWKYQTSEWLLGLPEQWAPSQGLHEALLEGDKRLSGVPAGGKLSQTAQNLLWRKGWLLSDSWTQTSYCVLKAQATYGSGEGSQLTGSQGFVVASRDSFAFEWELRSWSCGTFLVCFRVCR